MSNLLKSAKVREHYRIPANTLSTTFTQNALSNSLKKLSLTESTPESYYQVATVLAAVVPLSQRTFWPEKSSYRGKITIGREVVSFSSLETGRLVVVPQNLHATSGLGRPDTGQV